MVEYTLGKKERLNSKTLIERLFSGGSKSFPAFPLRVVYMSVEPVEEDMAAASILISVPKKRFKRAVKRNLVKRQVREAYRKNKHLLLDALASRNKRLIIAFIWLDNHIHSSAEVEEKVKKLLFHIVERLDVAVACLFLSGVHFSNDSSFMPFCTYLFGICHRGH